MLTFAKMCATMEMVSMRWSVILGYLTNNIHINDRIYNNISSVYRIQGFV
jgi:phosphoglycerol transferase MdoB-like AlkP superfamily enzyme